ncbi:hypothetical protein BS47DRAFT_1258631, partial [Hydnum rufescens UP504]
QQVSIISGYSQRTIQWISAKFSATGNITQPSLIPRGRPRNFGANEELHLQHAVDAHCSTYLDELCTGMMDALGSHASTTSIWHILRDGGYSMKRVCVHF